MREPVHRECHSDRRTVCANVLPPCNLRDRHAEQLRVHIWVHECVLIRDRSICVLECKRLHFSRLQPACAHQRGPRAHSANVHRADNQCGRRALPPGDRMSRHACARVCRESYSS